MTLIGKIITVAVFLAAIIWMTVALSVLATHTDYEEQAVEKKQEMDRLVSENKELKKQRDDYLLKVEMEEIARENALSALQARRTQQEVLEDQRVKAYEQAVRDRQQAIDELAQAQRDLDQLIQRIDAVKAEIEVAKTDRDKHFRQVVALTEELHAAVIRQRLLRERKTQLDVQVEAYRTGSSPMRDAGAARSPAGTGSLGTSSRGTSSRGTSSPESGPEQTRPRQVSGPGVAAVVAESR